APGDTFALRRPGPATAPAMTGYDILSELGRGGMGVVYKAVDRTLRRIVALKVILHGDQAGTLELARFRAEGETIAALNHPGIVQILRVARGDGVYPYMVMEFCPGGSLDKKLDGAPLTPITAAKLLLAVARAVHAAHEAGIIHRDLKPANILLDENGAP